MKTRSKLVKVSIFVVIVMLVVLLNLFNRQVVKMEEKFNEDISSIQTIVGTMAQIQENIGTLNSQLQVDMENMEDVKSSISTISLASCGEIQSNLDSLNDEVDYLYRGYGQIVSDVSVIRDNMTEELLNRPEENLLLKVDSVYKRYSEVVDDTMLSYLGIEVNLQHIGIQLMQLDSYCDSAVTGYEKKVQELQELERQRQEELRKQQEEESKRMLKSKLEATPVAQDMDISQSMGLSQEEISQLLSNSELIPDENVIHTLSNVMYQTVQEYPVNELFSISVMSLETGYFQSEAAVNKNNYGGMMTSSGNTMSFSSMEEGMARAIKCLHNNIKGSNTIYEVNDTYCEADENGDEYAWSKAVITIMRRYAQSSLNS